jgi:hypothetical protein
MASNTSMAPSGSDSHRDEERHGGRSLPEPPPARGPASGADNLGPHDGRTRRTAEAEPHGAGRQHLAEARAAERRDLTANRARRIDPHRSRDAPIREQHRSLAGPGRRPGAPQLERRQAARRPLEGEVGQQRAARPIGTALRATAAQALERWPFRAGPPASTLDDALAERTRPRPRGPETQGAELRGAPLAVRRARAPAGASVSRATRCAASNPTPRGEPTGRPTTRRHSGIDVIDRNEALARRRHEDGSDGPAPESHRPAPTPPTHRPL